MQERRTGTLHDTITDFDDDPSANPGEATELFLAQNIIPQRHVPQLAHRVCLAQTG
jgi:hypothetical protein